MNVIAESFAVSVTQDDIDHGEQGSYTACPVALALRRVLPPPALVRVGTLCGMYARHPDRPFSFWLSGPAVAFIRKFDAGRPVGPFTFQVTAERGEP